MSLAARQMRMVDDHPLRPRNGPKNTRSRLAVLQRTTAGLACEITLLSDVRERRRASGAWPAALGISATILP